MKHGEISALLMAFTIALSILGVVYSHWGDTVKIKGYVEMAHIKFTVISYKNLTSRSVQRYSNIASELSADGHTLTLTCDNVGPCWFVWIGLVGQNQGSLPAKLKTPEYDFDDINGFHDYFETKEYFYGPYPEETGLGKLEVWNNVKVDDELLPDGSVTFSTTPTATSPPPFEPIPIDPMEKAIIWIWIHCKLDIPPNAQGKTITMYIKIVDDFGF